MTTRRSKHPRGQAVTEVALGILVTIPIILGGLYLSEAAMFRLKATEAATEPMWDATAYQQQSYTGAFNRTPGAAAAASAAANGRATSRTLVFTAAGAPTMGCTAGTGHGLSIGPTASVYADNGGMSCTARLVVDPKGMTRFFLDQGPNGFFKEPMEKMLKNFSFCENERCQPFKLAIGDWGLTNKNQEQDECNLTMGGCANSGFFGFARRTYEAHRTGAGTRNDAFLQYVEGVVQTVPANLAKMTDFQMSFKGEESQFIQTVPVSEGEPEWHTTPAFGAWEASYGARGSRFLGL
jgi:hypothetical protein